MRLTCYTCRHPCKARRAEPGLGSDLEGAHQVEAAGAAEGGAEGEGSEPERATEVEGVGPWETTEKAEALAEGAMEAGEYRAEEAEVATEYLGAEASCMSMNTGIRLRTGHLMAPPIQLVIVHRPLHDRHGYAANAWYSCDTRQWQRMNNKGSSKVP